MRDAQIPIPHLLPSIRFRNGNNYPLLEGKLHSHLPGLFEGTDAPQPTDGTNDFGVSLADSLRLGNAAKEGNRVHFFLYFYRECGLLLALLDGFKPRTPTHSSHVCIVFIDRDPVQFRNILEYLRHGDEALVARLAEHDHSLRREFSYFMLQWKEGWK